MLTNGMLESLQSVITLPEISSAVLLYILDILYSGNPADHPLVSRMMALEATSAAHFFLLPNVNKIVQKYLWAQVTKVAEESDFPEAASMLTSAMEMNCIVHDEDVVLLELVRLLEFKWMQVDCAVNLSEEALDYILRITKLKPEAEVSLDEYFRVRGVVLWRLCQGKHDFESAREAEKLVNFSLPLSKEDLYKVGVFDAFGAGITWFPNRDNVDSKDNKLRVLLSTAGCKESIARLLMNTDLLQIPAALLVKTVGPLQLLLTSRYTEVLENHAVRKPIRLQCKWIHDPIYATENGGLIIRKQTNGSGSATCLIAARSHQENLQWLFCVESNGGSEVQLGLACGELGSWSEEVKKGTLKSGNNSKVCMVRIEKSSQTNLLMASKMDGNSVHVSIPAQCRRSG